MLSKLNIYLLAVVAFAGLASAIRSSDRVHAAANRDQIADVAETCDSSERSSTRPDREGGPAVPDPADSRHVWYPDLSELSVPVQFAFAAVRTVVAEGNPLRAPIPELAAHATYQLSVRWLVEQTEPDGPVRPWSSEADGLPGSAVRSVLRATIQRIGPPRHV